MLIASMIINSLGIYDTWFIKNRSKLHIFLSFWLKIFGALLFVVGLHQITGPNVIDDIFKIYLIIVTTVWIGLITASLVSDKYTDGYIT